MVIDEQRLPGVHSAGEPPDACKAAGGRAGNAHELGVKHLRSFCQKHLEGHLRCVTRGPERSHCRNAATTTLVAALDYDYLTRLARDACELHDVRLVATRGATER